MRGASPSASTSSLTVATVLRGVRLPGIGRRPQRARASARAGRGRGRAGPSRPRTQTPAGPHRRTPVARGPRATTQAASLGQARGPPTRRGGPPQARARAAPASALFVPSAGSCELARKHPSSIIARTRSPFVRTLPGTARRGEILDSEPFLCYGGAWSHRPGTSRYDAKTLDKDPVNSERSSIATRFLCASVCSPSFGGRPPHPLRHPLRHGPL
jgi:hypothetical protein